MGGGTYVEDLILAVNVVRGDFLEEAEGSRGSLDAAEGVAVPACDVADGSAGDNHRVDVCAAADVKVDERRRRGGRLRDEDREVVSAAGALLSVARDESVGPDVLHNAVCRAHYLLLGDAVRAENIAEDV